MSTSIILCFFIVSVDSVGKSLTVSPAVLRPVRSTLGDPRGTFLAGGDGLHSRMTTDIFVGDPGIEIPEVYSLSTGIGGA